MLARDWYDNERRRIGLGSAVDTIHGSGDDAAWSARMALHGTHVLQKPVEVA